MRAVLITGASTGIGLATTRLLAQSGYAVFAGVRSDADGGRLRELNPAIVPVLLDVTNAEEIAQAASAIEASAAPLAGVVNNAGIAVAGPLEHLSIGDLRRQFEVNLFGALAVTQACLPHLRRSRGRVVFMSSVSGQIAPPYLGPYAASKFALEALADSLRMELAPSGIAVSIVQPGNVKTPIWSKGRADKERLTASLPPNADERYRAMIETLIRLTEREERTGIEPEIVAAAVLRALRDPTPRARYQVGAPPGWQRRFAALLPERWRDRLILKNFKP